MKSFRNLAYHPAGQPIAADDLVEFHAARLLLLLYEVGINGQITGLTKLAKLDFLVRYPAFLTTALRDRGYLGPHIGGPAEAPMIRFHYGPWDHRYYHVLAYLEATRLVSVHRSGPKTYSFVLTALGSDKARELRETAVYTTIIATMQIVRRYFARNSGKALKEMIYRLFDQEIVARRLGETIRQ